MKNTPRPSSITVFPARAIAGAMEVPGDKSISQRVALLGALAEGRTEAAGFLASDDCIALLKALRALGAEFTLTGDRLTLQGAGARWRRPDGVLDLGNSGTGIRLLSGLLAGQPFTTELTGDASLRSRPMRRIQEPLERMGARVELLGPGGCAPVRVTGGRLRAIEYRPPVASAQVKSCVLLAGLFAEGRTRVIEPVPTRDHTERLLAALGVPIRVGEGGILLEGCGSGGPSLRGRAWTVPGDFSSAAFWIAAAAALPGSDLTLRKVGLNPRRTAFLTVLRRMGADIAVETDDAIGACEITGTIRVRGRRLRGTAVGGAEIPDLIDELPLVAVVGAVAEGQTEIRDAGELRVKESDRIVTMAGNLRRLGVRVEERRDGLIVHGPARPTGGGVVDSHGDHRIPMAMTVLSLHADGPVHMNDVGCVAKSYPGFWLDLERVGGHAERRDRD
jgi:3-phosphoshikimate 1-carboxyvinyltransferase